MNDVEVARVALGAAELIRTGGHMKGAMYFHGRYCAVGAVAKVINDHVCSDAVIEVTARIAEVAELPIWKPAIDGASPLARTNKLQASLVFWNDASERTGDEVIIMFEQVAANLKGSDD
jgi:hypothetical protein